MADGFGSVWGGTVIEPLTKTQAGAWCLMLAGLLGMAAMVRWYRPARPVFAASVLVVLVALLAGCNGQIPGGIPERDGTWSVGMKVDFGTYRTLETRCRWSVDGSHKRHGFGPSTVRLTDADTAITVHHCGKWAEVHG